MQLVPIQAVPNQQLFTILDSNNWGISIKTTNGCICVSLVLNNVVVVDNARAVAGEKIIPSQYEENGNFAFLTQSFQVPDYTQFGVTQNLFYASAAELVTLRTPEAPPLTAAFFNPIAALPLRFSPQGY